MTKSSITLDFLISLSSGTLFCFGRDCSLPIIKEAILRGFQIQFIGQPYYFGGEMNGRGEGNGGGVYRIGNEKGVGMGGGSSYYSGSGLEEGFGVGCGHGQGSIAHYIEVEEEGYYFSPHQNPFVTRGGYFFQ